MIKIGIYPGTFDPITKGHINIILRSFAVVDKLIVAIAQNSHKSPLLTLETRLDMVRHEANEVAKSLPSGKAIDVIAFDGLLVDFAYKQKATIIVRGLRAASDFEYEFQMASVNSHLAKDIETVFLPAMDNNHYISSSVVKEVLSLRGDVSTFVSGYVKNKLMEKIKPLNKAKIKKHLQH